MSDTREVTSNWGSLRLFCRSSTEAACLSARHDGLFEEPCGLFDFQLRVVFEAPRSALHHFPSEIDSDKKCHSLVIICASLTKASSHVV